MSRNYILLFYLLCSFNIIIFCSSTLKHKSKGITIKNKTNNEFTKRKDKNLFSKKKKLQSEDDDEPTNHPFIPLNIFIDTAELEETCPGELRRFLDNIINAMYKAKNIVEGFLKISPNTNDYIGMVSNEEGYFNAVEDYYQISNHDQMFNNDLKLNVYNYFIFGKFIESGLNDQSASDIFYYYANIPCFGIILFNRNEDFLANIDESKFTLEYLTLLMLRHFIRILGFHEQIISDYNGGYFLDSTYFLEVIDYAKTYFGCPNIEAIRLYKDDIPQSFNGNNKN